MADDEVYFIDKPKKDRVVLGIGTGSPFGWPQARFVEQALNWGVPNVMIFAGATSQNAKTQDVAANLTGAAREAVVNLVKALELPTTVHAPIASHFGFPEDDEHIKQEIKKSKAALEHAIDLAMELGSKSVTIHPASVPVMDPLKTGKVLIYNTTRESMNIRDKISVLSVPKHILEKAKKDKKVLEDWIKLKNESVKGQIAENIENIKAITSKSELVLSELYTAKELLPSMKNKDEINELINRLREIGRITGKAIDFGSEPLICLSKGEVEKAKEKLIESISKYVSKEEENLKLLEKTKKEYLMDLEEMKKKEKILIPINEMILENAPKQMADVLAKKIREAKLKGIDIKFGIENLPSGMPINKPEELNEFVRRVWGELKKKGISDPENWVGAVIDTAHIADVVGKEPGKVSVEEIKEWIKKVEVPIVQVHFSEAPLGTGVSLPPGSVWSDEQRQELLKLLKEKGAELSTIATEIEDLPQKSEIFGLALAQAQRAMVPEYTMPQDTYGVSLPGMAVGAPGYLFVPGIIDPLSARDQGSYFMRSYFTADLF